MRTFRPGFYKRFLTPRVTVGVVYRYRRSWPRVALQGLLHRGLTSIGLCCSLPTRLRLSILCSTVGSIVGVKLPMSIQMWSFQASAEEYLNSIFRPFLVEMIFLVDN